MDRVNQRENHLLGENIKRLRLEHNLRNCDVLAQLQLRGVDIARSTYSKIEMGLNNPTVDLLIALADFYQVSFDEFFKKIED
ncbi:helix-turn-helix domain-containing protein [uncultured Methanobrevibacter sp.]|uniref:helix-turn-helix domain-containing protein n=1 Tax=uncultured Methanobrevibacter sp. TaxID=253161 RepID=UPI0025EF0069|nr:helix-turn-helix transcriptional regulator [uncultured Methanobrevibacter sp.]MDY3275641.1 helix-turn-helix transcriptional regulator [Agathobacter sp.]